MHPRKQKERHERKANSLSTGETTSAAATTDNIAGSQTHDGGSSKNDQMGNEGYIDAEKKIDEEEWQQKQLEKDFNAKNALMTSFNGRNGHHPFASGQLSCQLLGSQINSKLEDLLWRSALPRCQKYRNDNAPPYFLCVYISIFLFPYFKDEAEYGAGWGRKANKRFAEKQAKIGHVEASADGRTASSGGRKLIAAKKEQEKKEQEKQTGAVNADGRTASFGGRVLIAAKQDQEQERQQQLEQQKPDGVSKLFADDAYEKKAANALMKSFNGPNG